MDIYDLGEAYVAHILYNSTELYHYGVKGMKWGKRKANPTTKQTTPFSTRITTTGFNNKNPVEKYTSAAKIAKTLVKDLGVSNNLNVSISTNMQAIKIYDKRNDNYYYFSPTNQRAMKEFIENYSEEYAPDEKNRSSKTKNAGAQYTNKRRTGSTSKNNNVNTKDYRRAKKTVTNTSKNKSRSKGNAFANRR